MGHQTCCVVNCKNNGQNSKYKFYKFPRALWKLEQRNKWITAVKRKNADGSPWYPKPHDTICSAHFVGGKKADEQASPSYVPTIFPAEYKSTRVNGGAATLRYKLFMERRNKKEKVTATKLNIDNSNTIEVRETSANTHMDKECQVDIFPNAEYLEKTLICNRYIYANHTCDAEVQTEIANNSKVVKSFKIMKHKGCNTAQDMRIKQPLRKINIVLNFNQFMKKRHS